MIGYLPLPLLMVLNISAKKKKVPWYRPLRLSLFKIAGLILQRALSNFREWPVIVL